MKTAIQLTMFRVFNYGSALQAYALSAVIGSFTGWRCLTIDYPGQITGGVRRRFSLKEWMRTIPHRVLYWRRTREYNRFLQNELLLVGPYFSHDELLKFPPYGDVYITGSDQTFNPYFSQGDTAYFLDFAPSGKRLISYASSFAVSRLDRKLVSLYRDGLSSFSALSTREESGVPLVKSVLGRDVACCCDPTFLLTVEQWRNIARKAVRRHPRKYILVYLLAYMVNPYPEVLRLVHEAQEKTGYEVVFLNGCKKDLFVPRSRIIKNASPYEFVDLFMNAEFILTSSFHGAVFSTLSGHPFIACVSGDEGKDSRVRSILKRLGCYNNMVQVPIQDDVHFESLSQWMPPRTVSERIEQFRSFSLRWLRNALLPEEA